MRSASEGTLELSSFEVVGPQGAPVVVALGGISSNRHICANGADERRGWWESIAGRGRALDTTRYQLIGVDFLDGGCRDDGRPERIVTTYDQADAIIAVLDSLGIDRVHAIVGASYGGMVALAFADKYPHRLERLIAIGAAHEAHPLATAWRSIQRRIVELGLDTGRTRESLALARSLAMTTYRTAREFADRFAGDPVLEGENSATFPVEPYLKHHGEQFAATWRPERFLALSLSSDLHRVTPSAILAPAVFVAAASDALVPREQIAALAAQVSGRSELVDLPTESGHDGFLIEPEAMGKILSTALSTSDITPSAVA
jgi:homoserine O-acetyltransferase